MAIHWIFQTVLKGRQWPQWLTGAASRRILESWWLLVCIFSAPDQKTVVIFCIRCPVSDLSEGTFFIWCKGSCRWRICSGAFFVCLCFLLCLFFCWFGCFLFCWGFVCVCVWFCLGFFVVCLFVFICARYQPILMFVEEPHTPQVLMFHQERSSKSVQTFHLC